MKPDTFRILLIGNTRRITRLLVLLCNTEEPDLETTSFSINVLFLTARRFDFYRLKDQGSTLSYKSFDQVWYFLSLQDYVPLDYIDIPNLRIIALKDNPLQLIYGENISRRSKDV